MKNKIIIIFGILTFLLISVVSAIDVCCVEGRNGEICQDIERSECSNFCEDSCELTSCDRTAECKIGCCFDPNEGKCSPMSPKGECENEGGEWHDDEACNVYDCQKACCILGNDAEFVTLTRCEKLSDFYGLELDFRQSVQTELECLGLAYSQIRGACIIDDEGKCEFLRREECLAITSESNFYENYLCTSPELETICEPTEETTCVEERDEVYFVDSCGNLGNIYDASRINDDEYWSRVFSKEESCNSGQSNAESVSCGNCDYLKGSRCGEAKEEKPRYGDNICRNLDCETESGYRKNGESWCVYDGSIGFGEDVVGSRHWIRNCIDGEVNVEPCAPYRQEICVESQERRGLSLERVSSAGCRENRWRECVDLIPSFYEENDEGMMQMAAKECLDNPDCYLGIMLASGSDKVAFCLPHFPPGFDFKDSENKEICNLGTNPKCSYNKKHQDRKDCVTEEWTQMRNEICRSLGDCGAYVNIEGKVTTGGYMIVDGVRLSMMYLNSLKEFANPDLNRIMDLFELLINKEGEGSGLEEFEELDFLRGREDVVVFQVTNTEDAGGYAEVHFYCLPWEQPLGGSDCEKCTKDPLKPCSKYRCGSLGKTCEFINEGTGNELCIDNNPFDVAPPIISPLEDFISEGYKYTEISSNSFKIIDLQGGCIEEFTPLEFGIETNEYAVCRIDSEHTAGFEEMASFFGNDNMLSENHTTIFSLPSSETVIETGSEGENMGNGIILNQEGKYSVYVRCQDANGNTNREEYTIQMCVKAGPDTTAPYIRRIEPESGAYVKYNVSEKTVKFYVNEPAECRWSKQDKDYEDMENEMSCENEISDGTVYGWPCTTTLTNISGETTYYTRCKDRPWEEEGRNVQQQGQEYVLVGTEEPLSVKITEPVDGEEIIEGFEPITVILKAFTSGGLGEVSCEYSEDNLRFSTFFETGGSLHIQELDAIYKGDWKFYIKCQDEAGNRAENFTQFKVTIDESIPKVARVFYDSGLKIITTENAECSYSIKNCRFRFENGTKMSGSGIEHTADWQTDFEYHIKCKDKFGNAPSRCSIVVKAYD